jgi:acetoacetyl-CoA reductase
MALAQEGARNNILVNTVSPGYTATEMLSDIKNEIKNKIEDSIPLKRFGQPREIAKTIVFLLSEDSGYTTGANIPVNGGLYIS